MSAPTSIALPPGPGIAAARGGGSRAGAADRGAPAAFGSALEDALAGPSGPATPRTRTADDAAADAVDSPAAGDDTDAAAAAAADTAPVTPPAGELPPGIWALLNGVHGPATPPAGGPAAGELPAGLAAKGATAPAVGAVSGSAPATDPAPVATLPPAAVGQPAAVPAPATPAGPTPGGQVAAAAAVDTLARAQAAGLTVVTAPAAGSGAAAAAPPAPTGTGVTEPAAVPGPAVLAPVGTDAPGADTSGDGGSDGTSAAPAPAAADPGTAPGDDLTTGVPGTAPLTGTSAAPAAAAVPAGARETPVAAQLAPQLAVLQNAPDGSQTMTVVLTPDALGEVTVQVTITDGTLDLMLRGGSEHGRHALADALPELRRELEASGLTFSRLAVDPDAPRDGGAGSRAAGQQLFGDLRGNGGQQQGQAPHRSRAWATSDTSPGEGPAPAARPSASSGVDLRV